MIIIEVPNAVDVNVGVLGCVFGYHRMCGVEYTDWCLIVDGKRGGHGRKPRGG